MPKRKATRAPARRYKRRRVMRRRVAKKNVLTTNRFVIKQSIVGNDAIPNGTLALTFALSDTPAFAEFTTLFDQYKINRIQYRFVLRRSPDHTTNLGVVRGWNFRCMFVVDRDDSLVPANFLELQQYPKVREVWLNVDKPVTRWYSLTPSVLYAMYNGVASTGYAPKRAAFVDVVNSGLPHYGLKIAWDQLYTGTDVFVECRYHMSFQNPR